MPKTFEVLQNDSIVGYDSALEQSLQALEEKGYGGPDDDTPITVVLTRTGKKVDGVDEIATSVFIGGNKQDIINHLKEN